MSYSFRKFAPNRQELMDKVNQELNNVVMAQPVHARDCAQAAAAAEAFLAIVPDPAEGQVFCIDMHGSVSYKYDSEKNEIGETAGASVGVSVYHAPKEAQ